MTDPKQAKCLTDPNWRFYKDTDLKRTFARVRKAMKEASRPVDQSHVVVMPAKAKRSANG